jgi:hypothetical protein
MDLVAPQLLHVRLHGQEEIGGHGRRMQPQRVGEVAVEITPAKVSVRTRFEGSWIEISAGASRRNGVRGPLATAFRRGRCRRVLGRGCR